MISMNKPYFDKNNFKLYHANSINLLAELPENSVDMIFADPPYLLSNGGFNVHTERQVIVDKRAQNKSNRLRYEIII